MKVGLRHGGLKLKLGVVSDLLRELWYSLIISRIVGGAGIGSGCSAGGLRTPSKCGGQSLIWLRTVVGMRRQARTSSP